MHSTLICGCKVVGLIPKLLITSIIFEMMTTILVEIPIDLLWSLSGFELTDTGSFNRVQLTSLPQRNV